MRTFPMIESNELRAVADATVQTNDAIICCFALQGLDLKQFLLDLDAYRTMHLDLNPIADEMISRTVISLTDTVRNFPQKNG